MAKEDNLKPQWKKGQSGNPNGRPKNSLNIKKIILEMLALEEKIVNPITKNEVKLNQLQIIVIAHIKKSRKGDVRSTEWLSENGFGKVTDRVEIAADASSVDFRTWFNFKHDSDKTKD